MINFAFTSPVLRTQPLFLYYMLMTDIEFFVVFWSPVACPILLAPPPLPQYSVSRRLPFLLTIKVDRIHRSRHKISVVLTCPYPTIHLSPFPQNFYNSVFEPMLWFDLYIPPTRRF